MIMYKVCAYCLNYLLYMFLLHPGPKVQKVLGQPSRQTSLKALKLNQSQCTRQSLTGDYNDGRVRNFPGQVFRKWNDAWKEDFMVNYKNNIKNSFDINDYDDLNLTLT